MAETRKLAAILFADVVGYSRMMGEDEAGTVRAVRDRREAALHGTRERDIVEPDQREIARDGNTVAQQRRGEVVCE